MKTKEKTEKHRIFHKLSVVDESQPYSQGNEKQGYNIVNTYLGRETIQIRTQFRTQRNVIIL